MRCLRPACLRINSDLANDLGNLLHRTLNMIGKFNDELRGCTGTTCPVDENLIQEAKSTVTEYKQLMDNMHLSDAIKLVWSFISRSNKYVDETMGALAKIRIKKQSQ